MKLVSCSILLAASSLTWAEIAYQVDVHPDKESLHVTMTLPKTGKGSRLQIPNWAPGAYVLRDNFKSVLNLRATDGKGKVLKIETQMETLRKPYEVSGEKRVAENSVCTWTVEPAPQTVIEYDINLRVTDGAMHWSGPSTYLYDVNRLREKCRIVIKTPEGWPVYIGLDEVKNSPQVYTAKDYDVLADNPVTVGSVLVDEYVSRNRPHFIVMRGAAKSMVDRQKLLNACKLVSDFQGETFGDFLPMNKYVWHFDVNPGQDGAGGLEHLSSTQISLAAGVGPRAVSVISHEYFHLWNVKRIRSKVLGPFDYTRLPETGAIWWLEGVTDYYAHYLLYRFSFSDEADFFADIVSNFNAVRRNPAHLEISPYASSFRVGEASNGRGNSNGYRISYYNQGWLVGMVLDLAIRSKTQGRKSLDHVLINLWNLCKRDGPGFEEDEIRKQLIRVGGAEMGDLYDRIVMKPGDMAIEETLAKVGLKLGERPETYVDRGFTWSAASGASVLRVDAVQTFASGLQVGDVVLGVQGKSLGAETGRRLVAAANGLLGQVSAGSPIQLKIRRGDQEMDVQVVPQNATRMSFGVDRLPDATPEQKAVLSGWLAQRKPKAY